MPRHLFHPLVQGWFDGRFGQPTEPQALGWPHIAAGQDTLIAAPTGSGKTLAAFLVCLDGLIRNWIDGSLDDTVQVVYVSPLKALSNDIERNLQTPLAEIRQLAELGGTVPPPIRVAVRTGDTPAHRRQAMLRLPPHILVTTPESLYLLLTAEKSRELLRSVRTVIVDEIHALARDKRGSHLSLSLERLAANCSHRPVRIGLSATQRPIERIARFLVGTAAPDHSPVTIDAGHLRDVDLAIETPPSDLSAVCSNEQWAEIYTRLAALIAEHHSTLIFVGTRRLAERVTHHLSMLLGEDAVASHHGSLARPIRLAAESRLKAGQLKAIVATASLELGIDIGSIDLVCQIGSPRSIATLLQRIGRSGHSLGKTPKGRLFPLTRDELLECMALVRAVGRGDLDAIQIPDGPLDILAQQIVAAVASQPWEEDELYQLCRGAWPYRNLDRKEFDTIVERLSEGIAPPARRGKYLHRDRIHGRLRATRGARLAAITNGGAIPETAEYRVISQPDGTLVGTVDEDFAIETAAGNIFLLGNTSWLVLYVRRGEVAVRDAQGAPPTIPFWFGEAPARTAELSRELSDLRTEIAQHLAASATNASQPSTLNPQPPTLNSQPSTLNSQPSTLNSQPSTPNSQPSTLNSQPSTLNSQPSTFSPATVAWLMQTCGVDRRTAEQAVCYVAAQQSAIGLIPSDQVIVFERFFDESGGMQLVIHAPFGARINRAWGLALRKRFCRSFDFELQAAANDNGIVLSLSPQHSFPIDSMFRMIGTHNARPILEQAVLDVPLFQVRWRWNATRALAVLRFQNGRKVPPYLQRFRADDLLAAAFPQSVGCQENHQGDVAIPDHPLVRQTMADCLHEAMDLDSWLQLLTSIQEGRVQMVGQDTREPSPFCHELLNANPYAFLDDAPLEERRTRAVATRRTTAPGEFAELARLDQAAIDQVAEQAWPVVRNEDELHEALQSLVLARQREVEPWAEWCPSLVAEGRAARVQLPDPAGAAYWIAAENWPLIQALFPHASVEPAVQLPGHLLRDWPSAEACLQIVRGRAAHCGPLTARQLADDVALDEGAVAAALEALEGQGVVLRGRFSDKLGRQAIRSAAMTGAIQNASDTVQWCDRRLLARIHRLTLSGLRQQIQPAQPSDFVRFLCELHHLHSGDWAGPVGVREAVVQLQGFELPAGAWEEHVLAARFKAYDPSWLDHLFLTGELVWGRLMAPNGGDSQRRSHAALTRSIPLSVIIRSNLPWLLPHDRQPADALARSDARQVLDVLRESGALFTQEIVQASGLLATQVDVALRQLAALGLVTCDSYTAVRGFVGRAGARRAVNGRRRNQGQPRYNAPVGRWSCFPGHVQPPDDGERRVEDWCRQLLSRYGVLFRDLLTRETAAPPWHRLVRVLRRLELKGEVRGGRFVSGVAGEQYAMPNAVEQLRAIRDRPDDSRWFIISAADPLNLSGVLPDGPRIPATHTRALVVAGGRFVAARQAGRIEFFAQLPTSLRADMWRALQLGRRPADLAPSQHALSS